MPRQLASLIIICVIVYLFRRDGNKNEGNSIAIFIPFIWVLFPKYPAIFSWIGLGASRNINVAEGNPVARLVYLILILSGLYVLVKRNINWRQYILNNLSIYLFFVFGALSILWSDYPFISFKRWVKSFGVVVMVLIILTENRPYESIGVVLKYISYIFLPISVLFIKYYPALGRTNHMDKMLYTGIAATKNGLAQICLIAGIYFAWKYLFKAKEKESINKLHPSIYFIIFIMILWLLYKANSATSMVCLILSILIFLLSRIQFFKSNYNVVIPMGVVFVLFIGFLDFNFNLKDHIIIMLGRRPDLTSRIPMWEDLISMVNRPMIGYGYESFWLGDRLQYMIDRWDIDTQAHNGYIEMYLNLGWAGVFFIFWWMFSGLRNINHHLSVDYSTGILRLVLFVVITLYNYTEATFFGVNTLWILFFIAISYNPKIGPDYN